MTMTMMMTMMMLIMMEELNRSEYYPSVGPFLHYHNLVNKFVPCTNYCFNCTHRSCRSVGLSRGCGARARAEPACFLECFRWRDVSTQTVFDSERWLFS